MDELLSEEQTGSLALPSVGAVDVRATDDSPLANALRRRKREIARPEPVIAAHDSAI